MLYDDRGHISSLDEYLMKHEDIQRDNDLKEDILNRLLDMCVRSGVDVSRFDIEKDKYDDDIIAVTLQRYLSGPQIVNVKGMPPITMLKEIIIKGDLG